MEQCTQTGCSKPGVYRFTWPGRNESYICENHAPRLRAIADAMGFYVQLIPLEPQEEKDKSSPNILTTPGTNL